MIDKKVYEIYIACLSIIIIVSLGVIFQYRNVTGDDEEVIFSSNQNGYSSTKSNLENADVLNNIESEIEISIDNIQFSLNKESFKLGRIGTQTDNLEMNFNDFVESFPLNLSNEDYANVERGRVLNCESDAYNFIFSEEIIEEKIYQSIVDDRSIELKLENIIQNSSYANILEYCEKYKRDARDLYDFLEDFGVEEEEVVNYFSLMVDQEDPRWMINNRESLKDLIVRKKNFFDRSAKEPIYKLIDGQIYIMKEGAAGREINVEATMNIIDRWLNDQQTNLETIVNEIQAPERHQGNVYNLTNLYAEGKSRIDIIRDGRENRALGYAHVGLEEIDDQILMPGEEFSFIRSINLGPDGLTEEGYGIGGGICNSTTTLFRAALEAGFPITQRSPHTFYVTSYEWGYEENIVEATYNTDPQVDFRFRNDLNYPVMLDFEFFRPGDNYQYHTVKVLTDPRAEKREVEIGNWNIQGRDGADDKIFRGSFDRIIKKDGRVVQTDTFESNYYRYLGEF
jgi:vancomycin resistance protein YoaR